MRVTARAALGAALAALVIAPATPAQEVQVVDRTVVRFTAPETGGVAAPRFVLERVLAFEARLEALMDPAHRGDRARPYTETHVRVALERHIAESLLSSLSIEPAPAKITIEAQMELAR